jgi:hypothetical protein
MFLPIQCWSHHRARRKEGRVYTEYQENGYGAIVVARHPNGYGSLIGVALGRRSANEAYTEALKECLRAGGTHAKVRVAFKG